MSGLCEAGKSTPPPLASWLDYEPGLTRAKKAITSLNAIEERWLVRSLLRRRRSCRSVSASVRQSRQVTPY
jgi:hypothetical protein